MNVAYSMLCIDDKYNITLFYSAPFRYKRAIVNSLGTILVNHKVETTMTTSTISSSGSIQSHVDCKTLLYLTNTYCMLATILYHITFCVT